MYSPEPLFFGEHDRLFGVFHHARAASKNHCVVISPPLLDESLIAHWTLRQVAGGLLESGHHVLRFDFAGSGNSHGELSEIDLNGWRQDFACACHEAKQIAGSHIRLSVVAVRYAASVLLDPGCRESFDNVVLWDPVFSGGGWLEELAASTASLRRRLPRAEFGDLEFSGHILGKKLVSQLSEQSVDRLEGINARRGNVILGPSMSPNGIPEGWAFDVTRVDVEYDWSVSEFEIFFLHDVVAAICDSF